MRSMRPRGESISSPHDWYVGQAGRQKPQWTQSSRRLRAGAPGGGRRRRRGHSEPSHEAAGIQAAVGVEPILERRMRRTTAAPVPRRPTSARTSAGASSRTSDPPPAARAARADASAAATAARSGGGGAGEEGDSESGIQDDGRRVEKTKERPRPPFKEFFESGGKQGDLCSQRACGARGVVARPERARGGTVVEDVARRRRPSRASARARSTCSVDARSEAFEANPDIEFSPPTRERGDGRGLELRLLQRRDESAHLPRRPARRREA